MHMKEHIFENLMLFYSGVYIIMSFEKLDNTSSPLPHIFKKSHDKSTPFRLKLHYIFILLNTNIRTAKVLSTSKRKYFRRHWVCILNIEKTNKQELFSFSFGRNAN